MLHDNKLTLCIFIDAFGWELAKDHSFLDDFLTTKSPLGTVFGYSATCDPTILTGKMPREHSHFAFFRYDPVESPFGVCRYLAHLPAYITSRGRVRRWLSQAIQRYYGFSGYFQIYNMPFESLALFDYSEKRDLYEANGINSGALTIFDHLRDRGVPFHMSNWRASEKTNLSKMETAVAGGEIQFGYLYLAAMDAILHAKGTKSRMVRSKIRWYEDRLRRILELAQERYDELDVFVFSDHGMADVTAICDLMTPIEHLGLRFGEDYVAVYDSTMARFWFLTEGTRQKIVKALEAIPDGRILSDATLADYGCDFPHRSYGELFFLLNPGTLLCPSFMGEKRLAGMHGYDPYDKDSVAFFGSNVEPNPMPARLDNLSDMFLASVFCDEYPHSDMPPVDPLSGQRKRHLLAKRQQEVAN